MLGPQGLAGLNLVAKALAQNANHRGDALLIAKAGFYVAQAHSIVSRQLRLPHSVSDACRIIVMR